MPKKLSGQVKVELLDGPMPVPVFANHAHVVDTGDVATLTFYAALIQRVAPGKLPEVVEGRPVAQIVMPSGQWKELLDNIFENRDKGAGNGGT
jgi:hypothetical protein